MALQNNQHLSEVDIALAGHDLTSWVLEDDMCDQLFYYGAEESHSHFVGAEQGCDDAFNNIDVQDYLLDTDVTKIEDCFQNYKDEIQHHQIPEEKQEVIEVFEPFTTDVMILNDDMHMDELVKAEMKHQHQLDLLKYVKENEEQELLEKQQQLQLKQERELREALLYQEHVMQQENKQRLEKLEELSKLQQQQQHLMQQSTISLIRSPESGYGSVDSSPSYETCSDVSPSTFSGTSAPCIIPVTISEACSSFGAQEEQFTQIECSDIDEQEKFKPGKLIIKVKKHCVPVIVSPSTIEAEESRDFSERTLKEVLQSDDADMLIRNLMNSSSSAPSFTHQEETCSSVMSDDSMDDEIPNNIGSLLSPSSSVYSSDYSSSPSPSEFTKRASKVGVRGRPYATADRKERKKEQNKRAALRYREKRREEEMRLQKIVDKEHAKRSELIEKYRSLQMEVKCMKKLARDMLVAQGKI